jgi:citronellol/citronellal dehydrogenase
VALGLPCTQDGNASAIPIIQKEQEIEAASGTLAGKTIVMSGGSRGIGLAIALRAAVDGANIVLLAKTAEPDPRLHGTVFTAAEQLEAAGGNALPVVGDVRSDEAIDAVVDAAVRRFGGIDICLNNASAISVAPTASTSPKTYDLMQDINVRGTFMLTRACLPHLLRSSTPRVLTLSPPLTLDPGWLATFPAYMISKFGMTLATLGIGAESRDRGLIATCLWPRTAIATDAVRNLLGGDEAISRARTPQIVADAAHVILTDQSGQFAGRTVIDDDVLRDAGATDFARYAVAGNDVGLIGDFFLGSAPIDQARSVPRGSEPL